MGIMAIEKALDAAKVKNQDLVEVAPNVNPPVCKIMDYGKHQYYQKKVETKHKKSQKKTSIKGIRMGFKTGEHDVETKIKQARKFLESGNGVKISLLFKGREVVYKDLATEKMLKFQTALEDIADMEAIPKSQGNTLIMMLTPKK